jgi:DNA polymerase III gamma/tau subunit
MDQFRNLLVGLIVPGGELLDMIESERAELKHLADLAGQERLLQSLNLLIAKEGSLRFTAHPRLVLETIIIKLCHLEQILPVDQLLERLAELESHLPAENAPPSPPLRSPARPVAAALEPKSEPKKSSATLSIKNEDWDDFQSFITSKIKPMANVIKSWHLTQVLGDTLEITSTGDSFSTSYFDDPDHLKKLETQACEYFKRPLKIKPMAGGIQKEAVKTAPEREKSSKTQPAKTELAKPVQDILELFQGEVKQENGKKKG